MLEEINIHKADKMMKYKIFKTAGSSLAFFNIAIS